MQDKLQFYIDGKWVDPVTPKTLDVINPANEEAFARISAWAPRPMSTKRSPPRAEPSKPIRGPRRKNASRCCRISSTSIRNAMATWWKPSAAKWARRWGSLRTPRPPPASPISAPRSAVLKEFEFHDVAGTTAIVYEPVGVCGLITPWNWPINQIACKVAPALAAGCTMVLKPSEMAPMSALLFAEILHEAGVPPGVFNLVNGDGPTVGEAMCAHPGIDMMSFTGSTRAGIAVAKAAADTVKRVAQELGGKIAPTSFSTMPIWRRRSRAA